MRKIARRDRLKLSTAIDQMNGVALITKYLDWALASFVSWQSERVRHPLPGPNLIFTTRLIGRGIRPQTVKLSPSLSSCDTERGDTRGRRLFIRHVTLATACR